MSEANERPLGNLHLAKITSPTGKQTNVEDLDLPAYMEAVKRSQIQSDSFVSVYKFMTEEQITAAVMRTLSVDHSSAINEALSTGRHVHLPMGLYRADSSIRHRTTGQMMSGEGPGYGEGEFDTRLMRYEKHTAIVAMGTGPKRVMTRRLQRTSSGDANDAPMSAVIDVQADGVFHRDFCVWLNCDYTDPSPANLGDNWDTGIFVGCRSGYKATNVHVYGYYRKAGFYMDVTRGNSIPELLDWDGNPVPTGTKKDLGDGCTLTDCKTSGGLIGLAILGGRGEFGGDYYDEVTGQLYNDDRGGGGFSDFNAFAGSLISRDHHSGRRAADPSTTPLTPETADAEPDFSPAALYIDGISGNSSGSLWNMNFWNTRISSREMFRVRLRNCDRVKLFGIHFDAQNYTGTFDTHGNPIDIYDYGNVTYGQSGSTTSQTGDYWIHGAASTSNTLIKDKSKYHVLNERGGMYTSKEVVAGSVTGYGQALPLNCEGKHWTLSGFSGAWFPGVDNQYSLGTAGNRASQIYAASSAISTSDAREKTDVRPLTDEEMAAAADLAKEIGFYQFLSAVEEKGDEAREHCGMTVQRAIEVLESHGLDPMAYSFICYDEWGANEDQGVDAGNRYSFRPDGLQFFIIRGFEARLSALE